MDVRSEARRLYQEEHLSPSEIAERLGVSPGTIRSWKKRDNWDEKLEALQTVAVQRNREKKRKRSTDTNRAIVHVVEESDLDEKEKEFCMEYIRDYNATQAAIRAGYKGSYAAIRSLAWAMLRKPKISALIKSLKEMKRLSIIADIDDMIELQMRIAFSDIGNYVDFGQREVPVMGPFGPVIIKDDNGQNCEVMRTINYVDFKFGAELDTQLISEISQGKDGAKLKLASRDKALDFLAQYFMANPMDKHKIEYDKYKLDLEQQKIDADNRRSSHSGSVVIPDAVWRSLMNQAYAQHLTANQAMQIYFGGSSSGKSFAILGQRTVRDVMTGKRNYLVCRKVAGTIRRSCFNEIWKCITRMDLEGEFERNKSEMIITHIPTRAQILFSGLDDVEKVKSITPEKGVVTDIIVEEATEIDYDDYKQLQKRLRGDTGDDTIKRITLLFNPIMQDHWIYTEFFAGVWDDGKDFYLDDKLLILRTTYKDNRWLTEDDTRKLEDETDKYYYDVYTLGKWGVLGNLIFTNWEIRDLSEMQKATHQLYNGLDFGFYPDPAAYTRSGYHRAKKEVYVFAEMCGTDLTNDMLAEKLKPVIKREVLTCDSAEPKSIQELNNFGINAVPAIKGPGSLEFGIKWLQRQRIIVDPRCVQLILELKKYKYREDRNGRVLPEPVDKDNHLIDSLRYGLESVMVETRVS